MTSKIGAIPLAHRQTDEKVITACKQTNKK